MAYVPAQGDVVSIDFDPQSGYEQAGRRPALVLSTLAYNKLTGLAVLCPITKKGKGYKFEVPIPEGYAVYGVILADQVKSMSWLTRDTQYVCLLPTSTVKNVVERVNALIKVE
ncbi:MAG: type II toxin-antitoxin system PemK/MazF family toxin [Janthinobacterium lividum]